MTTHKGRLWFYGTIRNFFSLIPAEHRADIDGKPLVVLYNRAFAADVDETLFPAVRKMFRDDFGTDIYLVKMRDWPGKADSQYQWGAALSPQILDTAAIGPGYDHSAVPGRAPLVRKRDDGRFYRFGWGRLLSKEPDQRPWLVHLETWNEYHEGTEICETLEFGRQYIELTREFADLFHARQQIDMRSLFSRPEVVSATPKKSLGVEIVDKHQGDGPIMKKTVAGESAWTTVENRFVPSTRYMYFDVDYGFLFDGDETLEVTVRYFDSGPKSFFIEYDSQDSAFEGLRQQFRPGPAQTIEGSNSWKTAAFTLEHARFAGSTNGCDFRLTSVGADLSIGQVTIRRPRHKQ